MATNMETEGLHTLNNGVEVFEKVDEEDEDAVEEEEGGDVLPELPPTLLELSQSNSEKEETAGNVPISNNNLEEEDDDDDEDEDDDEDVAAPPAEGSYDPSEFDDLNVDAETKELFGYIMKYTPQTVDLETKFRPFIPEYIPAVGDIDAFIKTTRPDGKDEMLGLKLLDEPSAQQTDPSVLELHLRVVTKKSASRMTKVKRVKATEDTAAIEKWIRDIGDVHRSKPPPTVHYQKAMPDIDDLMQEWPEDFEEDLRTTALPTADLAADLTTQVDIICGLLDIPRYRSRIQSLHVLFTLYSAFTNSQHFNQLAREGESSADVLTLPE